MARVGEEFPLECPGGGGDIRLIAFITEPGPIRKILAHLGEPLEPLTSKKKRPGYVSTPDALCQPFSQPTPDTPPDSRMTRSSSCWAPDRTRPTR